MKGNIQFSIQIPYRTNFANLNRLRFNQLFHSLKKNVMHKYLQFLLISLQSFLCVKGLGYTSKISQNKILKYLYHSIFVTRLCETEFQTFYFMSNSSAVSTLNPAHATLQPEVAFSVGRVRILLSIQQSSDRRTCPYNTEQWPEAWNEKKKQKAFDDRNFQIYDANS